MLAKDTLEQIRAASDIVDIIGAHVPLKRAGGSFKGLCPFHKEKTPSFHVNPGRQSFHCFGCKAGGDVFSFVQQMDGLDFMGAVRMLAERAGIPLEFDDGPDAARRGEKDQIFKVMSLAEELFRKVLADPAHGGAGRNYLENRKLDDETVETFNIGYAPGDRGYLEKWARSKKISRDTLEAAGLLGRLDSGETYERFRARLMFPVKDEAGRTVAFSGRLLDPEVKAAKYVNSPETVLFRKSRILYGLSQARKRIVEERTAIVCEGQIDVIRCHEAGFTNTVAPLGTALTSDHARLLKRYCDSVVLLFDADEAGQKATVRSGHECLQQGLVVMAVQLPEGMDPDSFILTYGPSAFADALGAAEPLVAYQLEMHGRQGNLSTEQGRQRAARDVIETLGMAQAQSQREAMAQEAAPLLGLSVQALLSDLKLNRNRTQAQAREETQTEEGPDALPTHPPADEKLATELMLDNPQVTALFAEFDLIRRLTDPDCRAVAAILAEHEGTPPGGILAHVPPLEKRQQRIAAMLEAEPPKAGREFSDLDAARDLVTRFYRKELEARRLELRQKAASAQPGAREPLLQEAGHITVDLQTLKAGWAKAAPILRVHRGD